MRRLGIICTMAALLAKLCRESRGPTTASGRHFSNRTRIDLSGSVFYFFRFQIDRHLRLLTCRHGRAGMARRRAAWHARRDDIIARQHI